MQLEFVETAELDAHRRREVLDLCQAAFGEDLATYLSDAGAGLHLLGREEGVLVSHGLLVARLLETPGRPILRTGYLEMVATHPRARGRGYATRLLEGFEAPLRQYDLAALSPTEPDFYARRGWELWRGPLSVRGASGLVPSPTEESVMIRRLPRTPPDLDLDAPLSIEWRPGEVW